MFRECVALSLVATLASGCSLILDFDETALPTDAAIDAVYTQAQCDYLEPNDSLATAHVLTSEDTGTAAICAPPVGGSEDHDFYQFTATGSPATLSLTFSYAAGDLDLKLYASDGTMVAQSRGFSDGETLVCPGTAPACPALTAGTYVFEVLPGVIGAVNTYTFSVTQ